MRNSTKAVVLQSISSQNLLRYSEQLDNAVWDKTGYTVVANDTIDPSGTLTADKLIDLGGSTFFSQSLLITANTPYTHSFYFKKINHDWIRIAIGNGANQVRAWCNISNGTLGSVTSIASGISPRVSVSNVGNNWYRFSISGIILGATSVACFVASAISDEDITRVTNGERYQWGGQVSSGFTIQPYRQTVDTIII